MNPTISVLVTVYNREAYLAETLRSILNSTFQDFEIVVVDDCSSDRSVDIARQFASKDNRIVVHVNKKNLGDYHNRNKAASLAKGVEAMKRGKKEARGTWIAGWDPAIGTH